MLNLNKKRDLIKQISLISLFTALSIIILSLEYIIPGIDFIFFIIFPFLACLISLYTTLKGQLLYLALGICISFINIQTGFFNFLPNIIIGLIYGILIKKLGINYLTYTLLAILTSAVQISLIYPTFIIYQINLLNVYSTFFKIDKTFLNNTYLAFYLGFSAFNGYLIYLFSKSEIKKFKILEDNKVLPLISSIFALILLVLSIVFFFFNSNIGLYFYLCLILLLSSAFIWKLKDINNKHILYSIIGLTLSIIPSIIVTCFFYNQIYYFGFIFMIVYLYIYYVFMLKYKSRNKEELKDLLN